MKATLEFTLPDEAAEYRWAVNGSRYLAALQDLRNTLRDKVKYGDEPEVTWDSVRELFYAVVGENEVNLDD